MRRGRHNGQVREIYVVCDKRNFLLAALPYPFTLSFVSASLELIDAILYPTVDSGTKSSPKFAEVDEEAQKRDIDKHDSKSKRDDKGKGEDMDVSTYGK